MGLPSLLLTASVLASTLSLHICTKKLSRSSSLKIHGHDDFQENKRHTSSISLNLAGFLFQKSPINPKNEIQVREKQQDNTVDSSQKDKNDWQDSKYIERATIPFPKIRNIWERISYSWVSDLMQRGNQLDRKAPLEVKDLYKLSDDAQMSLAAEKFEALFLNSTAGEYSRANSNSSNLLMEFSKSPLSRAILTMYKGPFIASGLMKLLNTVVQFFPSLIVARILQLSDISTSSDIILLKGCILSGLLFVVLCTKTVVENQYFDMVINLGANIRGTLSTAIYRKSLKLGSSSRRNNTMGEIVNYMQIDTDRMEYVASSIHVVWDGILQIVGYTCLLLKFLGPSVFAGIGAMLIVIPVNAYFLKRLSALKAANLKLTDKRIKLTNEILTGIRAIKSYNWEKPFADKLNEIRRQELEALKATANTRAILVSVLSTAPSLVAAMTLGMYGLLGNVLNPTKVFTSLALFNQLRFPLIFLPMLFNTLAEGKVSLNRLTSFLQTEEVQNYVDTAEDANYQIKVEHGMFSWTNSNISVPLRASNNDSSISASAIAETDSGERRGKLVDVNFTAKKGELVAIVGPTGSGKTTLLNALLGELNKESGTVNVAGRVAYVSQSSWIPNDTLRNVILFGRPMDSERYQEVLKCSGLERDLKLLENGDLTEIGERGINLSGGQKQRVAIARALYDEADVYLFDDPLSALDNEVGAQVFRACINGNILKGKTRILVTHQLGVLAEVDKIVVMDKTETEFGPNSPHNSRPCRILDQGSLAELLGRGRDLSKYVQKSPNQEDSTIPDGKEENLFVTEKLTHSESILSRNHSNSILGSPNLGMNKSPTVNVSVADICLNSMPPTGAMMDCLGSDCDLLDDYPEEVAGSSDAAHYASSDGESKVPDTIPVFENVSSHLNNTSSVVHQPAIITIGSASGDLVSVLPTTDSEGNADSITASGDNRPRARQQLMTKEERGEGSVGFPIYKAYFVAAKKPLFAVAILISFILANASQILQQWVVSIWTSDVGYVNRPLSVYLSGVAFMAGAVAFFTWSRTYIGVLFGMAASQSIHRDMIANVMAAPLGYFESTPIGRLVQRFSKDLDQIDQLLPNSFGQLVASSLQIFGSMLAVCFVTPSFGFVFVAIFAVYLSVTNYYRVVARELKRLDSLSRSPIFSHFSETLGGLSIIRAFRRQKMFQRGNEMRLDNNLSAYFSLKAVDRWLSVRLEFLGNSIVLFSALLAVLSGSRAGSAGLSLNNALGVTSLLNWAVRNGAETEAMMTSVERVLFTINQTPQEHQQRSNHSSLAVAGMDDFINQTEPINRDASYRDSNLLRRSGWPWQGGVVFNNLNLRYREDFDLVLRGVDLAIGPGEKVGIVGRTGSGKSSLFRALLRLSESESGQVLVDGVDVAGVDLNLLRSKIAIIPQDPVLFSGTIRSNLDPFQLCSDEEIWSALEKVNLARTVGNLLEGLLYEVAESGDNFSAGQKQLLCLSRALLRKSRILLLDEATSSVDFRTDLLIQNTIRHEFANCTVLSIAHRLDTIMDADRILVMKDGKVGEYDAPAVLLKSPDSLFSQLLKAEDRHRPEELEGIDISIGDNTPPANTVALI